MNVTEIVEVIKREEEKSENKHICLVYESEEELIDILVPYFMNGLINNEVCVWAFLNSAQKEMSEKALRTKIPDLDIYIEKKQMILIGSEDLYENTKDFDPEAIIRFWTEQEKKALEKGFNGLRISGSGNWVRGKQWIEMIRYEKLVDDLIQTKEIKAICTYSNKIAGLPEILSVGAHHSRVIVRQEDKWHIIDEPNIQRLFDNLDDY